MASCHLPSRNKWYERENEDAPLVFFQACPLPCHPQDFELFFEDTAKKFLDILDCAVWYRDPEAVAVCPEPGSDEEMETSIKKIKKYPDDIELYPGHYEKTTLGYEKKNNPYLNWLFFYNLYDNIKIHRGDEMKVWKKVKIKDKNKEVNRLSRSFTNYLYGYGPIRDLTRKYHISQTDRNELDKYMINRIAGLLMLYLSKDNRRINDIANKYNYETYELDKIIPEIEGYINQE